MYLFPKEIITNEVKEEVRALKNGKEAGLDKITGEMIQNGFDLVCIWFQRLCNKSFKNGTIPDYWKNGVIVRILGKDKKSERKRHA